MRSTILTGLLATVATVSALPQPGWSGWNGGHGWAGCLNQTEVNNLISGYTYLLEKPGGPDFNSTAEAILSPSFMVFSDSINTLSQRPLGGPSYPSLEVFIATQAVTPPLPVVQTISSFYTCNQISWQWNATGIGANTLRVNGMIVFDVNATTSQINTVYSEFNTAAFQTDLGNPECKTSK